MMPTQSPVVTTAPSLPPSSNVFTFNVAQTLSGFTNEVYVLNAATYNLVFQQTIAAALGGSAAGVTPSSINAISVVDIAATRRRNLQQGQGSHAVAAAAAAQSTLSYLVTATSPSASFATLQANLLRATSSGGNFNALLSQYAQASGIQAVINVLASTTTGPAVITQSSSSTPPKAASGLSGGAIAGVVIGVLVGLCMCGALGYYYSSNSRQKEDPYAKSNDMDMSSIYAKNPMNQDKF